MASQTPFQRFSDSIVDSLILRFIPETVRPNTVTGVRMVMTPIVIWCVLKEYFLWATILFCVASLTDWIDGAMARTRDQVTALGKILDPIADKLLIGSLMVPLVSRYLSRPLALTIVLLELFFVMGGYYRSRRHQCILQANWWGKIKFNFQVFGTLSLLFNIIFTMPVFATIALCSYSVALGFGLVSLATQGF